MLDMSPTYVDAEFDPGSNGLLFSFPRAASFLLQLLKDVPGAKGLQNACKTVAQQKNHDFETCADTCVPAVLAEPSLR